jgi:GT2 family glycosyltransferase
LWRHETKNRKDVAIPSENRGTAVIEIDAPVDVLLVNYRTPDLTVKAVAALAGPMVSFWVRDNSGDVVVDDLADASRPSAVRLVWDGGNSLYAAGNNEIFRLGHARYVLLLNPDVLLPRQALAVLLRELRSGSGLWAVAPRLVNSDGTPQDYYRRFPSTLTVLCDRIPVLRRLCRGHWRRHIYANESFDIRRDVEAPPGACLLLDRNQLNGQLFDETLSLFYNDTDLCLRMARRGRRLILIPGAVAAHVKGASLDRAREEDRYSVARLYDANCLSYSRKNLKGWRFVLAAIAARRVVERFLRVVGRMRQLDAHR